jgi:hypothetical protein
VESINEGRQKLETINKVAELAADIKQDVPDFDLLQGNRAFVREGTFEQLKVTYLARQLSCHSHCCL